MRIPIDADTDLMPSQVLKLTNELREKYVAVSRPPRLTSLRQNFPGGFSAVSQLPFKSLENSASGTGNIGGFADQTDIDFAKDAISDHTQQPYQLERWLVTAHAYSSEVAGKIGILGRLFSGDASRVKAGVIHEAKRFTIEQLDDGTAAEVGVAIRLSVATDTVSANLGLTLVNLAAQAQLKNTDTRVGISVVGYNGVLGDLLPAPRQLNVETWADYMESFRNVQALVFGSEGWEYVAPTVLSYDDGGSDSS